MKCEGCGGPVNTRAYGWAQYVEGWEKSRKAGDTNTIMKPKRHQKFLCNMCVLKLDMSREDESLF